ncbi:MAG TPA: arginyltransferase, partial [Desulfocapsa sulfexigens]|nr:arginyltransferase [Desulfocapsa sulfexigens]
MSLYDEQCQRDFGFLETRMERFFAEMAVECPYHLPHDAIFY